MRVYLAGPLFTAAERRFNEELAKRLGHAGHEVWLPQDREKALTDRSASGLFLDDVLGLDWAEAVVANLDGADPDSGTSWECGYAYKRKPIIAFRTDIRSAGENRDAPCNIMPWQSAGYRVLMPLDGVGEIAGRIIGWLQTLERR
jgi:nucleoside 2-deoxyribosyltransferase